jgi:hypothetical protein
MKNTLKTKQSLIGLVTALFICSFSSSISALPYVNQAKQESADLEDLNETDFRRITYGSYECKKNQCPIKYLSEIMVTTTPDDRLILTDDITGYIRDITWTKRGTLLNIDWNNRKGNIRNENVTLNVIDSDHISLKDSNGKSNFYELVEAEGDEEVYEMSIVAVELFGSLVAAADYCKIPISEKWMQTLDTSFKESANSNESYEDMKRRFEASIKEELESFKSSHEKLDCENVKQVIQYETSMT